MLVLAREQGQRIIIGDDIVIEVIQMSGRKVRLGIEAPKEVSVHREEVHESIKREGEKRRE